MHSDDQALEFSFLWGINRGRNGGARRVKRIRAAEDLMLQFCGSAITTDVGLLAHRELDDTLEPAFPG